MKSRQPSRPREIRKAPVRARRDPGVQYTIRNVPGKVDEALRRKAAELGISLNEVLLLALRKDVGLSGGEAVIHHDLDDVIGSWQEDPEFDAIIAEQDRVDEEKWK
jgi:hypothetical protein